MFADQTNFITRWARVACWRKILNECKPQHCPRQKGGQFVRIQWRSASSADRTTPRSLDPACWKQAYSDGIEWFWHRDSPNINLMAGTNVRLRLFASEIFSLGKYDEARIRRRVCGFGRENLRGLSRISRLSRIWIFIEVTDSNLSLLWNIYYIRSFTRIFFYKYSNKSSYF